MVPLHLQIMRDITGTAEVAGSGDNPVIMEWPKVIAKQFPEMKAYCELYTGDDIAWCGLTVGYVMAAAGVRPIFGPTDTDKFLWAEAWEQFGIAVNTPVLGDVIVLDRHVTMFDGFDGNDYVKGRGGNQSDQVKVSSYAKSAVRSYRRPPPPTAPPALPAIPVGGRTQRPTLEVGSQGSDVALVQTCLKALPIDGDFGSITEKAVKKFQGQEHLEVDGVVGPDTWAALERVYNLPPPLPSLPGRPLPPALEPVVIEKIIAIAQRSSIATYSWDDRGEAPDGYTNGMAVAFAYVYRKLRLADSAALEMAKAETQDVDVDALARFASQFREAGMDNSVSGTNTLRHLFVLLMGLGMRESSGEHCCGRDQSADNTDAMTCEAGLFQMSWNMETCSDEMEKLMDAYDVSPAPEQCHLDIFREGVSCSSDDWKCYGSGEGYDYQELAKSCPQFAVETTAVGLRNRCLHWGPIKRYEVELRPEADQMFRAVQALMDAVPTREFGV
jgi:uncharacterized protein (TIGR02594 family)